MTNCASLAQSPSLICVHRIGVGYAALSAHSIDTRLVKVIIGIACGYRAYGPSHAALFVEILVGAADGSSTAAPWPAPGMDVVTQIALILSIARYVDPLNQTALVAAFASLIAFLSATQDVAIDAFAGRSCPFTCRPIA